MSLDRRDATKRMLAAISACSCRLYDLELLTTKAKLEIEDDAIRIVQGSAGIYAYRVVDNDGHKFRISPTGFNCSPRLVEQVEDGILSCSERARKMAKDLDEALLS